MILRFFRWLFVIRTEEEKAVSIAVLHDLKSRGIGYSVAREPKENLIILEARLKAIRSEVAGHEHAKVYRGWLDWFEDKIRDRRKHIVASERARAIKL